MAQGAKGARKLNPMGEGVLAPDTSTSRPAREVSYESKKYKDQITGKGQKVVTRRSSANVTVPGYGTLHGKPGESEEQVRNRFDQYIRRKSKYR